MSLRQPALGSRCTSRRRPARCLPLHTFDPRAAVMCMQVGSIVNFSLMYLLAPTAAAAAGSSVAGQSLLVRALSDEFLVKWGAPGGNMFQVG